MLTLVEDPGPKAPPAVRAWIEGLMADTASRTGDLAAADAHYRKALQMTPGDNFLLADYGEFLLDQGRAKEALALVAADTTSDTSFLVRVAAEVALGSPAAPADVAQMDARFAAMDARGDHVFLREQADFLRVAHHDGAGALVLARANWKVQRSPKDARAYLAAAIAAGKPAEAAEVVTFVHTTGMSDPIVDPLVATVQTASTTSTAPR
jgi:tetratricopeptide (TPR) repeat protein